jgi:oligopeptide/dipeptide ABC transporter ATP-binding protein
MLDLRGLTIRYLPRGQRPVQALKGVTIRVQAREILGITGESGSGKSTLGAAILRLLPAYADYSAGAVLFEGRDVLVMDDSELRRIRGSRIALISQDSASSLNPVLKIGTQISEVLRAHLKLNKQQRMGRVLELLREVGFDDPERIASAYAHELSGGQGQRVVIAQAVACGPALLIADEPTSKLDSQLQAEILALLSNVVRQHGTGLILITHDPAILVGLADRIAVMYAGSIVEEGGTADVVRNPLHPYTQALLRLFMLRLDRHPSKMDKFPAIVGEAPDLSHAGPGCCFEPRCLERMTVCATEDPRESNLSHSHRVSCFKYAN